MGLIFINLINKEMSQTKRKKINYSWFTKPLVLTVCKMIPNLVVFCMLGMVSGKMVKVYDFLDYRDVLEKDAGFLTLKPSDSASTIHSLCQGVEMV